MSEIVIPSWLVAILAGAILIVAALAMLAFLLQVGWILATRVLKFFDSWRALYAFGMAYLNGARFDGNEFRFPSGRRVVYRNGWPREEEEP